MNIHYFDTSHPAKNCILIFHAINQAFGLKCNGLLENDPINPGIFHLVFTMVIRL